MVAPVEAVLTRPVEMRVADEKPQFGVLAHAYQPPRSFFVSLELDGQPYQAGFRVVPEVNETITRQVYEPVLGEGESLPPGLITSIYAPLRSYLKKEQPELFARIQAAVANTPDKEYAVLGDPLIHSILPFLPEADQRMMFEAGKRAFANDFGFEPKGIWLPETAVTTETLRFAADAGYEFTPLRDSQAYPTQPGVNLDGQHNIGTVDLGEGREMAVVLGNSSLSQFVSYEKWSTVNADAYMESRRVALEQGNINPLAMSDLELYGHHREWADMFLKRALDPQVLDANNFSALDMRRVLEDQRVGIRAKTPMKVVEKSSWSCHHQLGRWTGECDCDQPTDANRKNKWDLYAGLRDMNSWINTQLDGVRPQWREEFTGFMVANCDGIFTGENFGPALQGMYAGEAEGSRLTRLMLAKIEVMTGMTSCGWFFGGDYRVERDIPVNMIQGVRELFPEELGIPNT